MLLAYKLLLTLIKNIVLWNEIKKVEKDNYRIHLLWNART